MADDKPTYPNAEVMVPVPVEVLHGRRRDEQAAGNALVEGAHKNARRVPTPSAAR